MCQVCWFFLIYWLSKVLLGCGATPMLWPSCIVRGGGFHIWPDVCKANGARALHQEGRGIAALGSPHGRLRSDGTAALWVPEDYRQLTGSSEKAHTAQSLSKD